MPETVSALNRKDPELEAFVKESVGVMVIWLAPEQAVLPTPVIKPALTELFQQIAPAT